MEGITNNQTVSATQLGLFESIADLLLIDPIFILVPSRFMRKFICRLRLNEVSRQ